MRAPVLVPTFDFRARVSRAAATLAAAGAEALVISHLPNLRYLSGLDASGYKRVVGEAILSGLPPEEVILLDLDPPTQKTAIDFAFTEQFWGVRALDPSQIEKRGRELWYDRDGKRTRIRRIYNRLIFDELAAKGAKLPFDFTSRLDVSWAGHPNWYFRWSKHCLPRLSHPTVPEARLLSDFALRW